MKALKVTLLLALLFTALTSCTKQDLNEDDALITPSDSYTAMQGGNVTER
ncbi:MAG: hypothetical protein P8X62_01625 [Flavobacteriaceae bacterium]